MFPFVFSCVQDGDGVVPADVKQGSWLLEGKKKRRDGMGYSLGFCLSFLFLSHKEKARIPSHIAHGRIMGKMYVTAALNR